MMAQSPSLCHVSMETEGEGNYASTEFSDTRDQQTDHGLTLQPKIQSSDAWLFEAADSLSDVDLDALLGTVQFDLDVQRHDLRQDDAWLYDLFKADDQLPEPPSKKRKLSREPPQELVSGDHSTKPAEVDHSVCTLPLLNSLANILQQPPPPNLLSKLSFPSVPKHHNPNGSFVQEGGPSIQSIGHGGQLDRPPVESSTPSGPNKVVGIPPTSCNLIEPFQDYVQPSQRPTEDGKTCFPEGNEPGVRGDSWNGDNISVFGDDEQELPIAESASEIPPSPVPDTQPISSLSSQTPRYDLSIPVVSVEENLLDSGTCSRKKGPNVPLPRYISKKAAVEFGIRKGLLSFNNGQAAPSASPVVGPRSSHQNPTSAAGERNNKQQCLLASPNLEALLPLSIAFAIAQPSHHRSILGTVLDSYNSAAPGHVIPAQLNTLFESLERKLNNDKEFQRSAFAYLAARMASSYNAESSKQGGKLLILHPRDLC